MGRYNSNEPIAKAKSELDATRAADNPANETKLIKLLASRNVIVTRQELQSPARYKVVLPDGCAIERESLLNLERVCVKLGIDIT